jgi:hypothetical protein
MTAAGSRTGFPRSRRSGQGEARATRPLQPTPETPRISTVTSFGCFPKQSPVGWPFRPDHGISEGDVIDGGGRNSQTTKN